MNVEKTRHLCMLPWVHATLDPHGTFSVCCHAWDSLPGQSLLGTTLREARNAEPLREMRLTMKADRPSPHCHHCYRNEALGLPSPRTLANARFGKFADLIERTRDDGHIGNGLRSLDLRLSNVCNLRCRTCGPHASTTWYADARALGEAVPPAPARLFKLNPELEVELAAALPRIQLLYFAGGEPLLDDAHYRLLDSLLAQGRADVLLDYNTNLTRLACGRREILPLWSRFESVKVGASVDGAGAAFNYLRKGADWEQVVANFDRIRREAPLVVLYLHVSVSVLNAFHLPDAIDEWLRLGMIQWPDQLVLNFVRQPAHFDVAVLDATERRALRARYTAYLAELAPRTHRILHLTIERAFKAILGAVERPPGQDRRRLRARFREVTRSLDRRRGERLTAVFPELGRLMREPGPRRRSHQDKAAVTVATDGVSSPLS